MKRTINDKFQRAGYMGYYISIIILGLFLSYDFFVTDGISIICSILALTISWMGLIIVINFYRSIRLIEQILPALMIIMFQLFIISTIQEIIIHKRPLYTYGIKGTLYFFCLEQQGLHFLQIKNKLSELRT